MFALNLANCPKCGKLYVRNNYERCADCLKEIEQQYRKCADYLREHRNCNIYELSEGTGVSVKQISKFIREGRISLADAPNVKLPCELCGSPVNSGTVCDSCRSKIFKDFKSFPGRGASDTQQTGKGAYLIKGDLGGFDS